MLLDLREVDRVINQALEEDIGRGDLTSNLVVDNNAQAKFSFVAKEKMVMAGGVIIQRIFEKTGNKIQSKILFNEGDKVKSGSVLIEGQGNAKMVLICERVALNILQHLCGIATYTRKFVDEVKGTEAKILDTRKTLPGLRELEKYAVRVGGGHNHRIRLEDGVLIKDNHIMLAGSIKEALKRAKSGTPALTRIEVECDTFEQVKDAVKYGADVIMLDNMTPRQVLDSTSYIKEKNPKILAEASGNVNLDTVQNIAKTGVDFVSVGALTHSAPSIDIGLDISALN